MLREKPTSELIDELTTASLDETDMTREEFTDLFKRAATALELATDDLVQMCKVSRPTIEEWLSGACAPHRVGRPSVFYALLERAFMVRSQMNIEELDRISDENFERERKDPRFQKRRRENLKRFMKDHHIR